jgi:hypothetical protein
MKLSTNKKEHNMKNLRNWLTYVYEYVVKKEHRHFYEPFATNADGSVTIGDMGSMTPINFIPYGEWVEREKLKEEFVQAARNKRKQKQGNVLRVKDLPKIHRSEYLLVFEEHANEEYWTSYINKNKQEQG